MAFLEHKQIKYNIKPFLGKNLKRKQGFRGMPKEMVLEKRF